MDHTQDIGYLKAKAENTENHIKVLFQKSDQQTALISDIHTLLKTHVESSNKDHDDIEQNFERMEETLIYCKKAADDHYTIKKFGMWVTSLIAIAWGAVWKLVDKINFS